VGALLHGAALSRAPADARGVRARHAARRPGHLSKRSGDDRVLGGRLSGLPRDRGGHGLGRAHARAPARGGAGGARDHVRAARGVRAARAGEHPHAAWRGDEPHGPPGRGGGRARRGAGGGPLSARPPRALEARDARRRRAPARRDPALLRADDHPVAADRRGAPARPALGADRDLRDALPPLEHRGAIGPAVPPHGRAHGVHHRRAPGGARGGRGAGHPIPSPRSKARR
jgi:hypothetical protein